MKTGNQNPGNSGCGAAIGIVTDEMVDRYINGTEFCEPYSRATVRIGLEAALALVPHPPEGGKAGSEEIGNMVSRIYEETRMRDGLGALLDRGSGMAIMVAMRRAVEAALTAKYRGLVPAELAYAKTNTGPMLWREIALDAFDKAEQNRSLVKQAKLDLGWKHNEFFELVDPSLSPGKGEKERIADARYVTEEMVERAEAAIYGRHERGFVMRPLVGAVDMRAALEAALTKGER